MDGTNGTGRGRLYTEAVGALLRDLLADGLPVRINVTGSSMSPFIRSGDLVTIAPLAGAAIRFGDVVAVLPGTRLVIHRVVGRQRQRYLTRGDAATRADLPVAEQDVLGRVAEVERGGRQVLLGLGPERLLIAALSRNALLRPLLWPLRKVARWLRDG